MSYSIFFSNIYDFVFSPVLNPIRKKIAQEVITLQPKYLIDMCCGTANQIKYFTNLPNTKIIGIDISDNMLNVALKNAPPNTCYKQDASQTNFPDNHFDVAILSFILHETTPEMAYSIVNEAKRIIKSNGKIIITDYIIDKRTSILGKMSAYLTEFLIGGEHFNNFKIYIHNGLFHKYVSDLQLVSEHRFASGVVSVYIFNNYTNQ